MSICVTLVHGTFAPHAEWCREDSALCVYLREALNDVVFVPFEWSGRNTLHARREAARRLAESLTKTVATHPSRKHFVISHSHGGNIVFYALRDDPDLCARLSGVICLSTPFLHAHRRQNIHTLLLSFATLITLGLVLLTVPILWLPAFALPISTQLDYAAAKAAMGKAFWLTLLAVALLWGGFFATRDWALAYADRWFKDLQLRGRHVPPAAFVRTVGDEASALLSVAQFGGWVMGQFVDLVQGVEERAIRGGTRIGVAIIYILAGGLVVAMLVSAIVALARGSISQALVIVFALAMMIAYFVFEHRTSNTSWRDDHRNIQSISRFVAFLLLCPLGAIALPGILAAFVFSFFFGPELAVVSMLLQLDVETTPEGDWQLSLFAVNDDDGPAAASLHHSHAYLDPRCHSHLAAWMARSLPREAEVNVSLSSQSGSST